MFLLYIGILLVLRIFTWTFVKMCSKFRDRATVGGRELDPATVFMGLTAFNALRLPLIMVPIGFVLLAQVGVSLARLDAFFALPDAPAVPVGDATRLQLS